MKNTTHRVVILNNVNSEIISQAILVLKNSESVCDSAVLAEAERVVEKYMDSGTEYTEKSDGKFLVTLIAMSAVIFTGLCIFALFKIF
ncbi:MAG: hypothetical protein IJR79_02315 [Clostridia bacterium]|nr:hypothetical protein [Clostridia bacterium]MBQ7751787.1 hypothetical protein [Clostridia bacterium]